MSHLTGVQTETKTQSAPTAWIDLASPSHPLFFDGLVEAIPELETAVTVREKTETVDLAAEVGFDFTVRGRDFDNTLLRKLGIPLRTLQLVGRAPSGDVSLSARNAMCVLASHARGMPSIHFTDNDITAHVDGLAVERLYNRLEALATHNVVPSAFETTELTKWGVPESRIHTYDGYKEDVYVAAFEPDPSFPDRLPFDEYLVVRPEALDAAYVPTSRSLVPDILREVVERGYNVVYLPRGRNDEDYADPYPSDRVFSPSRALDGLQLAWHSQCVLTGSGTMAREAACMGKPAVSFFPNALLSVDQQLVAEGRIFHSRSVADIVEFLETQTDRTRAPERDRAREVREEVSEIVRTLLSAER